MYLLHLKSKFLVCTGPDINIIRLDALDEDVLVDKNEAIEITGITQSRIPTIGTVNIKLINLNVILYVVDFEFLINTDGILG